MKWISNNAALGKVTVETHSLGLLVLLDHVGIIGKIVSSDYLSFIYFGVCFLFYCY